jgi:exonuclease III
LQRIVWYFKASNASGELLLYSGRAIGEKHEYGVGLIFSNDLRKALIEWTAVSERLITARLNTRLLKLTIIQCYAPINEATTEEKEAFYGLLEAAVHQIRHSDFTILMDDFNTKIGDVSLGLKRVMGRHGLGTRKWRYIY